MKGIARTVYYCDYCDEKSLKEKSVLIHERHCMANPNRICFTEIEKIKNDRLIQLYLTAMSAINLASFLLVAIQSEAKDFEYSKSVNIIHKNLDEIWEKLDKNLEPWTGVDRIKINRKYTIIVKEIN